MAFNLQPEQIIQDDSASKIGAGLLLAMPLSNNWQEFADRVAETLRSELGARSVSLISGVKGTWRIQSGAGGQSALPEDLLASALDGGQIESAGQWSAVPFPCSSLPGSVLLIEFNELGAANDEKLYALSAVAGQICQTFLAQRLVIGENARLSKLLEITSSWNQSQETDQLLEAMAESATELLSAERATIFLWDRESRKLIGRPALGVQGNELIIDDSTGIVGDVIKKAVPLRVDEDISQEQEQIDRRVDEQLEFKTRSLLCVPLVNSDGSMQGAFELINKIGGNFSEDDEQALVEMAKYASVAIEKTQYVEHLENSHKQIVEEAAGQVRMIGECPAIRSLVSTIERVANTELSVLILGENGTGKEVAARMVHYMSQRRDEVLVAVNCAALSETLLESELFGHEKGAFTDAHDTRRGKFELADGGSLFLDEIGDMSLSGQAKLLRVLEEKVVVRVGGSTSIPTDTRVIAATNQNLAELVRQKKFREDLFFRLNVVTIDMPPLRERDHDVIILAEHFLKDFAADTGRKTLKLTAAAKKRLLVHAWPGNVRELRNMMERLAYLSTEEKIDADELAFVMSPDHGNDSEFPDDMPLPEATREFQVIYIQRQIDRCRGNMTDAAKSLGLHRSNLYRKMKQLGMDV